MIDIAFKMKLLLIFTIVFSILFIPFGGIENSKDQIEKTKTIKFPVGINTVTMEDFIFINENYIRQLNLSEPFPLDEDTILKLLGNSPLSKYSKDFILASQETDLNTIFLLSLAIFESGWGEYPNSYNNFYGWNGETSSLQESIVEIAIKIKNLYLTEDGKYFNGYTVSDINKKYNGRKEWEKGIIRVMLQLYKELDFCIEI